MTCFDKSYVAYRSRNGAVGSKRADVDCSALLEIESVGILDVKADYTDFFAAIYIFREIRKIDSIG